MEDNFNDFSELQSGETSIALRRCFAQVTAERNALRAELAEAEEAHANVRELFEVSSRDELLLGRDLRVATARAEAAEALLQELATILNPHESYDATKLAGWARDTVEREFVADAAEAHAERLREKFGSFLADLVICHPYYCDHGKDNPGVCLRDMREQEYLELQSVLAETTPQSLARVKAEALRELKRFVTHDDKTDEILYWLDVKEEADHIADEGAVTEEELNHGR